MSWTLIPKIPNCQRELRVTNWHFVCSSTRRRRSSYRRKLVATKTAYGLDDKRTADFGTRCLLGAAIGRAAACVLCSSQSPAAVPWRCNGTPITTSPKITKRCVGFSVDQPIAALLKGFEACCGLLDTTLVVWASGEFGRGHRICRAWQGRQRSAISTATSTRWPAGASRGAG